MYGADRHSAPLHLPLPCVSHGGVSAQASRAALYRLRPAIQTYCSFGCWTVVEGGGGSSPGGLLLESCPLIEFLNWRRGWLVDSRDFVSWPQPPLRIDHPRNFPCGARAGWWIGCSCRKDGYSCAVYAGWCDASCIALIWDIRLLE